MDHTNQSTSSNITAQPVLNIGAILREARERSGMSVNDVAGRLKFAPRQITALEEGDFAQLPETAFVRGFVRSYARLLQLDEVPLLAALPGAQTQAAPSDKITTEAFPNVYEARKSSILWLVAALVVALVIGVLALEHGDKSVAPKPDVAESPLDANMVPVPEMAASQPVAIESAPSVTVPAAVPPQRKAPLAAVQPQRQQAPLAAVQPQRQQAPLAAVQPQRQQAPLAAVQPQRKLAPLAAVPPQRQQVPLAATEASSAVNAATAASAVSAASAPASVPVKRSGAWLRLAFDEDSWVEVKDGEGKILVSHLYLQGSEQGVNGVPPLTVLIGNAKGVRVYYKGKQVDLAPFLIGDVAHLKLD